MENIKNRHWPNQKVGIKAYGYGFTLIELLIVVAIIVILAAIAIPNFLVAQTRSKVSRVKSDLRALATAIESFRVDNAAYPVGTDDPLAVPDEIRDLFSSYGDYSFYTFRTKWLDGIIGDPKYPGLTTPIAYISRIPVDPFTSKPGFITYSYREDRAQPFEGWILSSFGPDMDEAQNSFKFSGASNSVEARIDGRNGDISERSAHPGSDSFNPELGRSNLEEELTAFGTYDPTNGTMSNGDLWRLGP